MDTRIGLFALLACASFGTAAADLKLTPPAEGSVVVTNAAGDTVRFRVTEQGDGSTNGNLVLSPATTATSGSVLRGTTRFLHAFGTNNTFLGMGSGNFTMSGRQNTSVGGSTLASLTTGTYNTALGFEALAAMANGTHNVAIGYNALSANTSGAGNIAIGQSAGFLSTSGDGNIYIGAAGVASENLTIRLGEHGGHIRAFIGGVRGATISGGIAVMINADGQLGTVSSSASTKDDIADMSDATADLMKLRPVTFHYKDDHDPAGRTLQYGLVAEEVEQVYPGLVAHSRDGKVETVMYQFLPPMLLNEFQKQQREIATLRSELAEIRQHLKARP